MLFGGLIIYHLRVIERLFGPAKYVVSKNLQDYAWRSTTMTFMYLTSKITPMRLVVVLTFSICFRFDTGLLVRLGGDMHTLEHCSAGYRKRIRAQRPACRTLWCHFCGTLPILPRHSYHVRVQGVWGRIHGQGFHVCPCRTGKPQRTHFALTFAFMYPIDVWSLSYLLPKRSTNALKLFYPSIS